MRNACVPLRLSACRCDPPPCRYNEQHLRWVALETWTYSCAFSLEPQEVQAASSFQLLLHGVDTVADIWLDGHKLAFVANSHRRHTVDVDAQLFGRQAPLLPAGAPGAQQQQQRHTLSIELHPAFPAAAAAAQRYPYDVPAASAPYAQPHYNFLRKPAADFGWDWGPAFGASGLHGGVGLLLFDDGAAVLQGVHIQQLHDSDSKGISLVLECRLTAPPGGDAGVLTAALPQLPALPPLRQAVRLSDGGDHYVKLQLAITQPVDLWWPAGFGKQALYDVVVTYQPDSATAGCHSGNKGTVRNEHVKVSGSSGSSDNSGSSLRRVRFACSSLTRRVGFRLVQLVTQPLAPAANGSALEGETFFFRVNGLPIFIKGANLIPLDILPTRATHVRHTEPVLPQLNAAAASVCSA